MSDQATPDPPNPWTVKGMPMDARARANSAARRADQTVGEWLQSAIDLKIQVERSGTTILPEPDPGMTSAYQPAGSLEIVTKLAELLPRMTAEAGGSRILVALGRKVMTQHLQALLLDPGHPPGHTAKRLAGPT